MSRTISKEVLATSGLLLVLVWLAWPIAKVSELTGRELVVVAVVSVVLGSAMFAAALHWLRHRETYLAYLIIVAIGSLMIAGVVTERVRGPACLSDEIDDPSLCTAPPAGVANWDAWWQGWAAAEGIMTISGPLGFAAGALANRRRYPPPPVLGKQLRLNV